MMTNLGYWRRLGAAVIAMLSGLPAVQSYAATTDAPAAWVAYAQLVGQTFQTWIESDDADAGRFQQYLDARMAAAHADSSPVSTILIQTWIGPDGRVTDVRFDSLGNADADSALRTLLTAHPISNPPPRDMRQPLRVRLSIRPNPDAPNS
ncbi:YbaB/EbfC family DNA-binding protein [Paraburkholderia sp. ZP32-5]|uniref:YbaB/EbfC family DNA-binding protein n=1 Tax=Paraburkholderia sp. ZP32-5 TaxID=2883245 RepID=UPI001F4698A3|nr:YbaB/EbfC family DNA-binding protein [Paraburkholderia sp. ZP32-5]